MKKIILLTLAVALVATAAGCRTTHNSDPFSLFEQELTVKLTLEINGSCSVFDVVWMPDGQQLTMKLLEPEIAAGYIFSGSNGEYILRYGDASTACEDGLAQIPQMVETAFKPSEDEITSIGTLSLDGETLTEVKTANVSYIFASDGTLESLSGIVCGRSVSMKFEYI